MANCYTKLSFLWTLPTAKAFKYTLNLSKSLDEIHGELTGDGDEDRPLLGHLPENLRTAAEDWACEVEREESDAPTTLWVHSENGGIDALIALIQHVLAKFDPAGVVAFAWSNDCSRPRVDAYGGGATVITKDSAPYINTGQWMEDQLQQLKKSNSPPSEA